MAGLSLRPSRYEAAMIAKLLVRQAEEITADYVISTMPIKDLDFITVGPLLCRMGANPRAAQASLGRWVVHACRD